MKLGSDQIAAACDCDGSPASILCPDLLEKAQIFPGPPVWRR
jgi:hypothetical protein